VDLDAERLRYAQPGAAAGHADGHVRRAHAGAEGAQRTGGAGVGVCPDDHVAGPRVALGHPLVADAHLDVRERGAALFAELADGDLRVGKLGPRRRRGVVDEEDRARHAELAATELADLLDGQRAGAVLGDRQVHGGHHDLPGPYAVGGVGYVSGDDLLGKRERGHASLAPA
jgi:hypothetical protein